MSEARKMASLVLSDAIGGGWGKTRSIASADDGADVEAWWPRLARVKFDRVAMGRTAAEMMVTLLGADADPPKSMKTSDPFFAGSTIRPRG